MAASIHQTWNHAWTKKKKKSTEADRSERHKLKEGGRHRSIDLLWKECFRDPSQWHDNCNCTQRLSYSDIKHTFIHEPHPIDRWKSPSWVHEELRGRGLVHALPYQQNEGVAHGKSLPCNERVNVFAAALRACAKNKDLRRGTHIHHDILQMGLIEECLDALVVMYAQCGALAIANELLDTHKCRNIVPWTAVIAGYTRCGHGQDALSCFKRMQCHGLSPDVVAFTCILKACGSIRAAEIGEQVHDEIARQGLLRNNTVLGTALMDMYVKCGALAKAQQVHVELCSRDVVSWNALITGYTQHGQGEQALKCFEQMQQEGLFPDVVTFTCILKACGTIRAVDKGKQIHEEICRQGLLGNNIVLGTALVDMYAKCGALEKAQQVLEELPFQGVAPWNALIAGFAQHGEGGQVLSCFEKMQQEGFSPDSLTYSCILKACGSIGAVEKGEHIHDEICRQGLLQDNIVLGTALVDMYAKCGALTEAQGVFEKLPTRDVVAWSALISGYVQHGQNEKALTCFEEMQQEGLSPNATTFACILKACGGMGAADKGEWIHDKVAGQGLLEMNLVLGAALVDMYSKCGALEKARRVLEELSYRDVVAWNALMAGFVQHGEGEQALKCFEQMQHDGLSPNAATFACVLNACNHLGLVEDGYMYFVNMSTIYGVKADLEHYTCMVDLLGRAGHLDKAVEVMEDMPSFNNPAVWCALLGACQKWGDVKVGRWAFEQALQVDKSDEAAYVLMASVYATAGMQKDAKLVEDMRSENRV